MVYYQMLNCRFATPGKRVQPPSDAMQNVGNASASFEDGITTVKFSRKKSTGDVNDFSLMDCMYFLYAWGGVLDVNTRKIGYHNANRRFISNSMECIPTSITFCPERCKIPIESINIFSIMYFLVDCKELGDPLNGSVKYVDTLEDSIANYSCDLGFRLKDDSPRICQSNAIWSGAVPNCTRE